MDEESLRPCDKCKGKGKVRDLSDYEKWAYPNGLPDIKCISCDGKGRILKEV